MKINRISPDKRECACVSNGDKIQQILSKVNIHLMVNMLITMFMYHPFMICAIFNVRRLSFSITCIAITFDIQKIIASFLWQQVNVNVLLYKRSWYQRVERLFIVQCLIQRERRKSGYEKKSHQKKERKKERKQFSVFSS